MLWFRSAAGATKCFGVHTYMIGHCPPMAGRDFFDPSPLSQSVIVYAIRLIVTTETVRLCSSSTADVATDSRQHFHSSLSISLPASQSINSLPHSNQLSRAAATCCCCCFSTNSSVNDRPPALLHPLSLLPPTSTNSARSSPKLPALPRLLSLASTTTAQPHT